MGGRGEGVGAVERMIRFGGRVASEASRRVFQLKRPSRSSGGFRTSWANLPLIVLVLVLVATIGLSVGPDQSRQAVRSPAIASNEGAASMTKMIMPTASSYIPDAPVLVPEGWTATSSS